MDRWDGTFGEYKGISIGISFNIPYHPTTYFPVGLRGKRIKK